MTGRAAENEQKQQLTAIGERTKHRSLNKLAKLKHHPAPGSGQNKKEEIRGEDWISRLPVDVLIPILSLLTLKEAGRTSVLSRKWRYLWTFITCRLNFDAWEYTMGVRMDLRIRSSAYARWVNQVLKLHQGPFVDEFIIRHRLKPSYYHHVDSWIKFAFEKGVKTIELDLLSDGGCRRKYTFPSLEKFWSSSNTVQDMQSYGRVTRAVGSVGFSSLTTLRLIYVDVTDEVIENFLANCPLLEELHVTFSSQLQNLKVVGVSLKLKSLEICQCLRLRVLEICAINLVSISYNGQDIRLLLTNAPALSKFSIAGSYCDSLMYKDHLDWSYLQQLERLKIKFSSKVPLFAQVYMASISFPRKFPQLCHLKQLELEMHAKFGVSLVIYTCLIKACPSLSRFAMRMLKSLADFLWKGIIMISGYLTYTWGPSYKFKESSSSKSSLSSSSSSLSSSSDEEPYDPKLNVVEEARAQASTRFQHQCLKVVELVGFIGHAKDVELASHLLEIAVSLDKLVINPRYPFYLDYPDMIMETEALERGRKCARLLETKLPPGARLVVL
ncbi:hypothetical protein RHMOL_Rhmol10G0052800 [Rhododendron molle]|uniref:Uncharacterized protein n=1 Tax=Rhododendron molle TaxID=49168 RepID=A0ACC0LZG3_RHOML|nr:hypothetical protein RHMOL_Rhmol10G0052800 [Rhododendron molle]